MTFENLQESDIHILTPIMKRAFDEDTRVHLGYESGGPNGYDDGSLLRCLIGESNITAYKIVLDGTAIGAFVLRFSEDMTKNSLELLFLDTSHENQGIGKRVWEYIEQTYSHTRVWLAETPLYSLRNHHFYIHKCGFHIVRIAHPYDLENGSLFLEKRMELPLP